MTLAGEGERAVLPPPAERVKGDQAVTVMLCPLKLTV
ncbi:hypothetical protein SAMN05444841_101731 [Enterobacter kobei]|nr:hypothetical protein SAMN05444841_101731 [Enterobacter kobei]